MEDFVNYQPYGQPSVDQKSASSGAPTHPIVKILTLLPLNDVDSFFKAFPSISNTYIVEKLLYVNVKIICSPTKPPQGLMKKYLLGNENVNRVTIENEDKTIDEHEWLHWFDIRDLAQCKSLSELLIINGRINMDHIGEYITSVVFKWNGPDKVTMKPFPLFSCTGRNRESLGVAHTPRSLPFSVYLQDYYVEWKDLWKAKNIVSPDYIDWAPKVICDLSKSIIILRKDNVEHDDHNFNGLNQKQQIYVLKNSKGDPEGIVENPVPGPYNYTLGKAIYKENCQ